MSSLQKALNEEVQKQEEQKLAEELFISMMGNSHLVEERDSKWIMKKALSLATVFKSECRVRYDK